MITKYLTKKPIEYLNLEQLGSDLVWMGVSCGRKILLVRKDAK